MQYNRESLVKIISEHFGEALREENSNRVIKFGRYKLNEIAKELDYTNSQFSRRINPNLGEEYKEDTYRESIIRTKNVIQIRELKQQLETVKSEQKEKTSKENSFKNLALILAAIAAFIAFQYATYEPEPIIVKVPAKDGECVLNESQLNATIEWQKENIQRAVALECLLFNLGVKDQTFENVEFEGKQLEERTEQIILNAREKIKEMGLLLPNGMNLANMFSETYSMDKMKENYERILPFLKNPNAPYREIITRVTNEARKDQNISRVTFDSILNKTKIMN